MSVKLPQAVLNAIKCGPVPVVRDLSDICSDPQTDGESVIAFAALHLRVPDGMKVGQPLILDIYQQAFIIALFDAPEHIRYAYLSVAARNGKTLVIAAIILAYLIGPLSSRNILVASAANSRDQAALCYSAMEKILHLSPDCEGAYTCIPSSKKIYGHVDNTEYIALSADAKTGYGKNLKLILLDEAGVIQGPNTAFTDMLDSRQGSYDDARLLVVSTQAASDADYFSLRLDSAERNQDSNTVSHVYQAAPDADLTDRDAWMAANPGLGKFRSIKELEQSMKLAEQIPAKEPGARNQLLNQRVAMEQLAISPSVWKGCAGEVDIDAFRDGYVSMGLDLSARNDLTAAVLTTEDSDGIVHVLPFVFCPTSGIEARARRDRAPYDLWVRDGHLHPVGGKTMDFDQIAEAIESELTAYGIAVDEVHYDAHRINEFQAACDRVGALQGVEWTAVNQHFKDMGVRLASLTGIMAEKKLVHGGHPVMAMAASVAVAKVGREGITALAKNLSTQRIDPLVALVMSAWPFGDGRKPVQEFNAAAMIG